MKLTVIGSADASNSAGRGHACYWLDGATSGGMMIDFGATALMGIKKLGLQQTSLDTIVITHLHGDHFGGLPFILVDALYINSRKEPLHIVGPPGSQDRSLQLMRVVYGDIAPKEFNFELRWTELSPGEEVAINGATIRAYLADHMDPPYKPLCLRITSAEGRVASFSGDTQLCDGLREAAQGADLLVGDCTGYEPYVGRHMTWKDWAPILPELGAKVVLLSHMGADVRERIPELLEAAPPGVNLKFADDGMVLEI